jgi:hypothetical protein
MVPLTVHSSLFQINCEVATIGEKVISCFEGGFTRYAFDSHSAAIGFAVKEVAKFPVAGLFFDKELTNPWHLSALPLNGIALSSMHPP